MKADLLRARNMKRYINQLTVAKKQCEKRIRLLGGPNYEQQEDGTGDEADGPQSQRVSRTRPDHTTAIRPPRPAQPCSGSGQGRVCPPPDRLTGRSYLGRADPSGPSAASELDC